MSGNVTALQKAIDGQKLNDTQVKGALSQAVDKITSLSKRAEKAKDSVETTATAAIHTAEIQGSVFLASLAEGYFGADRMKPGGVIDIRAGVAVAGIGYGLYEAMSGKGGGHVLSIANGIGASYLACVGRAAGQILAEKRGMSPAPIPAPPAILDNPVVQGPEREIHLTPEPRRRRAGRNRFTRAEAA